MRGARGAIVLTWRLHRWLYRRTGGRIGGRIVRLPALLLTTVGRKTGQPRTVALTYLGDAGSYVVIASNGGAARHPDWRMNLQAHPEAWVQDGRRVMKVRSRETRGAERDRLWARAVKAYGGYQTYQGRTGRTIPVIVLTAQI